MCCGRKSYDENGRTDEKGDGAQRLSDRTDIEGDPVYQTEWTFKETTAK